jgi:hypothetical protein
MGKLGKNLLGKIIGTDNSCCCCGPSIVSVKKIKVDNKDLEIAGLEEEFEKQKVTGKTPESIDIEGLVLNLTKINEIPEDKLEKFKISVLKEYEIYWQGKRK